ncbi:MAG: hemin receptor [Prevotella sp.]|nr:hemin receptor [Prevotella sp.]MDY5926704.1 hemin receptor [Prevotella sp.]
MKKIFLSACLLSLFMAHAHAQETYENTKLIDNDLNGTARYVGMGGAMEALGADISVINSNPAGIGLFRRSSGSVSFGLVSQDGASSFKYGNKTNASFDQAGFVYSLRDGRRTFINFGFNYHKSKNFDYILNAASALNGASQHKLSYMKALANENNLDKTSSGWRGKFAYTSQLDNLYYNTLMMTSSDGFFYNDASGYEFGRAETGYIGEYDFNTSVNVNDRVYLGITIGIHDVHYTGHSLYNEALVNLNNQTAGDITVNDERRITGTGYNASFGIIFRPVDASPFRIGLSVSTPTWYDLKTSNYTYLINNTKADGGGKLQGDYPNYTTGESYEFKLFTPWKFGVSLGHTVGNYLALGASYEYADYSRLDTRVNDGYDVDYWGDVYEHSSSDEPMNRHTRETLKAVSTLKIGAEAKVMPNLAVRAGYNYVSPMFKKEGYKDGNIDSYGSNYSSATDYTNWEATNRYTVGVGYTLGKMSFDLAYQYAQTNGKFHPFADSYLDYTYPGQDSNGNDVTMTESLDNYANAVKVSNKRNQLLLTLTYRF